MIPCALLPQTKQPTRVRGTQDSAKQREQPELEIACAVSQAQAAFDSGRYEEAIRLLRKWARAANWRISATHTSDIDCNSIDIG